MTDQSIQRRLKAVWTDYKLLLVTGAVAIILVVASTGAVEQVSEPPEWVGHFAAGYILIGIPSYIAATKIVRWLRRRNWVEVVEVDALRGVAEPYVVPPGLWKSKTVESGKPYKPADGGPWVVRSFDYDDDAETLRVTGPWMGAVNDVELMTARSAISANRGQLRTWARIGEGLYSKLPAIAQAIESAYWRHMADDSMDRTTTHPEVVQSHVVEDVEAFTESIELPNSPDVEEMVEQAAEEQVGEDMPDDWQMDSDADPGEVDGR